MKPLRECTVLVTPRSFGTQQPELRHDLEQAVGTVRYNDIGRSLRAGELAERIQDVDGLIAGLDEIDASVFASAPSLRVVSRYGVGISNVDLQAATAHSVVVTYTPGANAEAVAELAIGFMFALARAIFSSSHAVSQGEWKASYGSQISGRTVGLIGLGRIGHLVARHALALGCTVTAHDPYLDVSALPDHRVNLYSLDEVVATADFLSLHMPVTDETREIVNLDLLRKLRPEAFLINTARGELVVEPDLIVALESGLLRGAALDTLAVEPPEPDNPLLHRQDVIITPHIGAHTIEATEAMGRMAMQDLLAVLSGRRPQYPVLPNKETIHATI